MIYRVPTELFKILFMCAHSIKDQEMEKLQNVMLFGFGKLFIDDQQDGIGTFPLDFLICVSVTCHLQVKERIQKL